MKAATSFRRSCEIKNFGNDIKLDEGNHDEAQQCWSFRGASVGRSVLRRKILHDVVKNSAF